MFLESRIKADKAGYSRIKPDKATAAAATAAAAATRVGVDLVVAIQYKNPLK